MNETSTYNSATNALLNGETFEGERELNFHPSVMVNVESDKNGVLYCEFSIDGNTWTSLSFQYKTDRINPPHIFEKGKAITDVNNTVVKLRYSGILERVL